MVFVCLFVVVFFCKPREVVQKHYGFLHTLTPLSVQQFDCFVCLN